MQILQESRKVFIDETEIKPNKYAANVLAGVVGVISVVCILNEIEVFEINKPLVRLCLFLTVVQFLVMQVLIRNHKTLSNPRTKYIMISMILFLVLTLTVILNIHATLALVLPLLLATQYRSRVISTIALAGAVLTSVIAPILSYLLDTWSLLFMTGYLQTFCKVTITVTPGNGMTAWQDISQILLYWVLPQMMTILTFGIILFSATKHGIQSVKNQIQVIDLSHDLRKQLETNISMQEKILIAMSDLIESRDFQTGGHVKRTSQIVSLLMTAMKNDSENKISDKYCSNVIKSAPMHDLGKIAIADYILLKPGKLTEEEYETVKQHPVKSEEIISQALTGLEDEELLAVAKNMARYHHERMDGSGYPDGLKGRKIPLEARIMAIADVYDALVSERYYKEPLSFEEAFETIEQSMGTQFDSSLNKYFITCKEEIEQLYS